MRFSKADILDAFDREDRSYRLALMCTHWIRDIERYAPNAVSLARNLHMQVDGKWISDTDLAELLDEPMKRALLSSDFMLTYLHTLIRAPFELLSDYCEEFHGTMPGETLLSQMKSAPWYAVAYIVRNAVSHNFHIELGKMRDKLPICWRTVTITQEMEGQIISGYMAPKWVQLPNVLKNFRRVCYVFVFRHRTGTPVEIELSP